MNKGFFAGKRVLVMGLGRFGGGVDVAKSACSGGAKVTITDLASTEQLSHSVKQLEEFPNIEYHLGSHDPADFEASDIVVVNPAVPNDNELVELARRENKFVTSQISIFFELCSAKIIGITGAAGKSTTAALTAHLLRAGAERKGFKYANVWLSGNIGNEPLLTIIDQIGEDDLVVLELSSFQLEQLAQVRKAPQVALLTNLTPNHLDRYGTFTAYCDAKENIFKFQQTDANFTAVSIFNAKDKIGAEWFEKYKQETNRICVKFSADDVTDEIRKRFGLPARANLSNLAAALAITGYFGIEEEQIKASLPAFKPLPHRLELVAEKDGVKWYNDSKATMPESAIASLEAFGQPVIIIAGGYDKGIAFDKLGKKIAQKAKAAILIGQTAQKIAASIADISESNTKVKFAHSLTEAVNLANELVVEGDVVLLSPACASYDKFDNFEHRGQEFTRLVRGLTD
jgi:UDP-N-acetylmuramoylalanine--D-glutamate ligase